VRQVALDLFKPGSAAGGRPSSSFSSIPSSTVVSDTATGA
jgi:hypothetical protein